MPQAMRTVILVEMKRTLKPDGNILIIDFHPGKLRFPKGWLTKGIITISEIAAWREHFKNYRHFMSHGGMPTLIEQQNLTIVTQKIVSGGNFGLFLLSV